MLWMIKIDTSYFLNILFHMVMSEVATNSSTHATLPCTIGYNMALKYMEPYLKFLDKQSSLYKESFKKQFCDEFISSYMNAIKTLGEEPPTSYEDLWISFAKSANDFAKRHAEREEETAEFVAKATLEIPAEYLAYMKKNVLWRYREEYKLAKTAQDQAYRHFRDASSCFHMYNHAPTKEAYCEEYTDSIKEADNKIANLMIQLLPFEVWYTNKILLEAHPRAILKYEYDVF